MQPVIQFHLGQLPKIRRPALLAWGMDSAVVLAQSPHNTGSVDLVTQLAEAICLQLLSETPTSKLHFFEASPNPRFAHTKRVLANVQGGAHLTHVRQAAQTMQDLTQLAHQRFSRLASAQVNNWAAYNAQNPLRPEPWHFVLLTDLLALADQHSNELQSLQTLCEQGASVGIVPILIQNPLPRSDDHTGRVAKQLYGFWQAVLPRAWGLNCSGGVAAKQVQPFNQHPELWRVLNKFDMELGLDDSQLTTWADQLIQQAAVQTQQSAEADFLNVRLGTAVDSGKPVAFRLGEAADCYHAFVGGATRSGKSTMLNNLLLGACEAHSPEALQLSLLDFKSNITFGLYEGLAHVVAMLDSENVTATALHALTQFNQAIAERGRLFKAQQPDLVNGNLPKYNALAKQKGFAPLPRWVMVIDEAHRMFQGERGNPQHRELMNLVNATLSNITREGAGLGLHLIFCTQTLRGFDIPQDVNDNVRLRVILNLGTEYGIGKFLASDNTAPNHLIATDTRKQAVFNIRYGQTNANQIADLDALPDAVISQRLKALKVKYPAAESAVLVLDTALEPVAPITLRTPKTTNTLHIATAADDMDQLLTK
jgi:FtsK/SpoIIIE family